MSLQPQDVIRQLEGIAARDPRAPIVAACRRSAHLLRAGREGAQVAVLAELQQLAVSDNVRPTLQRVLAWAAGVTPYQNRALTIPK